MATFNSHQDIVKKLQTLSHKLAEDKLLLEELGEFQSLAKELYERTIILNYKAKEEKVHQENSSITDSKPVDQEVNTSKNNPVISTSKEMATEGILFDFSNDETDEDEVEAVVISEDTSNNEEKDEEVTTTIEADIDITTNALEEEEEVASKDVDTTTVTHTHTTEISNDDTVVSFYQKFTKVHDDSLMDLLASQKLDSLKGALGLNDKMQIISELFEGNTEAFENAIEKLDQQESDDKARITLSEIAAQHQWEADHLLVEDFAKLVQRRYAK